MGRIAEILEVKYTEIEGVKVTEVTVNPDGGSNITVPYYAPPGDDSLPLVKDSVLIVSTQKTGAFAAQGFNDPDNQQKSSPGEKRIYSRNAGGAEVADIWLKNDGTIIGTNANGSIEMLPDGQLKSLNAGGSIELKPDGNLNAIALTKMTFTAPLIEFIGNVLITGTLTLGGIFAAVAGAITGIGGFSMTGGDVTADAISLKTHTHPAGTPPGNTGGPQ